MDVAAAMLARARALGMRSVVVVGTGKNVGKTVVARALARAAGGAGSVGFTSIGRDGESVDMATAARKPQLVFEAGTLLATATDSLRGVPAVEVLEVWPEGGPLGPTAIVRVRTKAPYEIAGPHTAAGIRAVVGRLAELGAATVVVDGAVDRMAALAGGSDAVILACGAVRGGTIARIADEVRAVVARFSIPPIGAGPALAHDGALGAAQLEALMASRESRQVVLEDATRIAAPGALIVRARSVLDLRVQRPITLIACTVNALDRAQSYDVRALLEAVHAASGLPVYDVFAGECAA